MVDANATLETLRGIKNTIIGNPTQKKELATDGTLRRVLDWVNASEQTGDPIFEQIRIEAAHIIAAQAYGPPEALASVLEAQAPQTLLTALKDERTESSPRLALSLSRALRAVVSAAADTIGPGRWRFLRDPAHPARTEARLVLEDIFSPEGLDVILPYLAHPEPDVRRNVAILLARGISSDAHRTRITDYEGRSAIWSLIAMLGGDVRNQSAAAYALAEITRDNETMSRILTDRIPVHVLSQVTAGILSGSTWARGAIERGRNVPIPAEPSLLSITRPDKDEHIRVLDILCKFLPSRDGDLREAACLCVSTITRQLRPTSAYRDQIHSMVMWLNLALEEFVPGQIDDPNAHWMRRCRWKPNEIGGGEIVKRVIGACYILADFVNDREDLLTYAYHAGTLHRAVHALLTLPPIPIPSGASPGFSGRWGPGSTKPSSGLPPPPPPIQPLILQPPASPTTARARRISTGFYVPNPPPPGYIPIPVELLSAPTRGRVGAPSPGPVAYPMVSASVPPQTTPPIPPPITSPVPPPITPPVQTSTTSSVPPPISPTPTSPAPVQRRLSFAELARRGSESGVQTFAPRAPSRARRTSSSAGVVHSAEGVVGSGGGGDGTSAAAVSGPSAVTPTRPEHGPPSRSEDAMIVDPEPGRPTNPDSNPTIGAESSRTTEPEPSRVNQDVTMDSVQPTPVDVVMSNPAPVPATTRRRKKPPPDPALGPYTFSTSTPAPPNTSSDSSDLSRPAPDSCHPPAPESPLRAALLVLLASLTMHSEEHRRQLVEAGALGTLVPSGRRLVSSKGVTGALGAMASPDPEVRWAGVMLARAVGRSTGVLRTGLYDSGIGRAIFDMLMKGEPDKRVLVAVLRMCCNLLNQYSPMREMFIRDGGMQKLAGLCDAEEQTIRHLALWAFKNSLFRATSEDKRMLMSILGWDRLERVLDEPPGEALEQALMIVRNISHTEPDAEWLLTHLSPTKLINASERTMGTDDSASVAALFALAHTAYIPPVRQLIVTRRRVLEYIRSSLGHAEVQVRSAAALCVVHMAGCMPRRLREMREVGIDGQLKALRGREQDEDVRDNVVRALSFFEARE